MRFEALNPLGKVHSTPFSLGGEEVARGTGEVKRFSLIFATFLFALMLSLGCACKKCRGGGGSSGGGGDRGGGGGGVPRAAAPPNHGIDENPFLNPDDLGNPTLDDLGNNDEFANNTLDNLEDDRFPTEDDRDPLNLGDPKNPGQNGLPKLGPPSPFRRHPRPSQERSLVGLTDFLNRGRESVKRPSQEEALRSLASIELKEALSKRK